MSAAVVSFQCVEAYANQIIARLAKKSMDVKRRRGVESLTPTQLERYLGTDEKLTQVLPRLLSVTAPKRTKTWQPYRDLKKVRDSTVHLKSAEHYVRGGLDGDSLDHRTAD